MPIAYDKSVLILKDIVNGKYLALSSTKPNIHDSGSGYNITEPDTTTTSYQRAALGSSTNYTPSFETGDETKLINDNPITFPECVGTAWGNLAYFAIFANAAAPATGTEAPLYVGQLDSAIQPTDGKIPVVRAGSLSLSLLPDNNA